MFTSLVSTYLPLVCLASCKLGEHKTREQLEVDINQSHQIKLHQQNYLMMLSLYNIWSTCAQIEHWARAATSTS